MPRVAVVDTDGQVIDLLQELFLDKQWEPLPCPGGEGTLAVLAESQPSLIVMDLWLETPETGWRLLQELKSDPRTQAVPVVICTAAIEQLDGKEAWLQEHAIRVISKPFDIDALLGCAEAALLGRATAGGSMPVTAGG